MKRLVVLVLALMFGAGVAFSQQGTGQGQTTQKGTQLKTKIQDRKRLQKRDSTGVYHDQNVKNRDKRQKQNRSGAKGRGKGKGQGQGQRRGQGQGQGQGRSQQ